MIFMRGHDSDTAHEVLVSTLNGPATKTISIKCRRVPVEFCVARCSVDRPPQVEHHFGVSVHCRECFPVGLMPTAKAQTRRVDHDWSLLLYRGTSAPFGHLDKIAWP